MTQERAKQIWAQRGPQNSITHAMTSEEIQYVNDIWDTMNGNTSFMDAFFRIMNGHV